jgi:hypothetical protein
MNRSILFCIVLFASTAMVAQTNNPIFGIVRQNYFSQVVNPVDSTVLFEQFDSATIRLGTMDPISGDVTNIGSNAYPEFINLTGAALNPYDNTFIFIGASNLNTLDLNTGEMINSVPLYNPIEESYFDNFRFNNSDSTMYGLARRNSFDPNTMQTNGEVYLAKTNTNTGEITEISTTSVAQGFALAGSAIDPYQMVYYFSLGSSLLGLDIYDGSVYSDVPIVNPEGIYFDNFTYSCADTTIYGLVRKNFFSTIFDPGFPDFPIQVLDSSTVRLGKIDPNTGIVTIISPSTVTQGGYSLNSGAAIDPETLTFYYNTGTNLVGVSLVTGEMTSSTPFVFEDGQYFDLMRNFQNCYTASANRSNPLISGVPSLTDDKPISIYPNPVADILNIQCAGSVRRVEIISPDGKLVAVFKPAGLNPAIDISTLTAGLYYIKVISNDESASVAKMVKE